VRGGGVFLRQGRGDIYVGEKSAAHMPLKLSDVAVDVVRPFGQVPTSDMRFHIHGEGADMLSLIGRDPIKAGEKLPFTPDDFSGQLRAQMQIRFPLSENEEKITPDQITWHGQVDFDDVALILGRGSGFETGGFVSEARGQAEIDEQKFSLQALARLDGMAATIEMKGETAKAADRDEKITLVLDDATRERLFPALSPFISGQAHVEIGAEREGARAFSVDLSQAIIEMPWLGWKKGKDIAAHAQFLAHIDKNNRKNILIKDFRLKGESFHLEGEIDIREASLASARFHHARLNRGDDISIILDNGAGGYHVKVGGKRFDMRSFIKSVNMAGGQGERQAESVTVDLDIARVSGFHNEYLDNVTGRFKRNRAGHEEVNLTAISSRAQALEAHFEHRGEEGAARVVSGDGGALLRFFDYYDKVQGGVLDLELKLGEGMAWHGSLSLRDFEIVDEPRLARIVANPPPNGRKSLNDVAGGKINASRLRVDRAFGQIVRGENFLLLDRGIVRGPTVGATFQGVVYDAAGNISLTGTFMPAYGLNRMFSDVPLLGNILGNGRDRGLIGITFKMDGQAKNPRIIVNPLSVIAPGVFRQIFEFH